MPAKRKVLQRRGKAVRRAARSHLLIIECDSAKLASQGLHLGTGFSQLVTTAFPKKCIAIVQTSTEKKLNEDLWKVHEKYGCFRTVLIVGHSNATELALTAASRRSWATVGRWIAIFKPELLFLAACEAGQSEAVRNVFDNVGSLRQIYGSPVTLHKMHTAPMGVMLFMLLARGKINAKQSEALRIASYILTGGQMFRWRRDETGPGQELKGKVWDAVGNALAFGQWDLLERLVPTRRPR
jgi:hypothetical protein